MQTITPDNYNGTMYFDTWYYKAVHKLANMSPRQKIAMLEALLNTIYIETGIEVVHTDIQLEKVEAVATAYGIELLPAIELPDLLAR